MSLFLSQTTTDFDLGIIYLKLITEILLPVLFGISLQRFLGYYVRKHIRYLTLFDKSIILLIIYKSFAESFEENIFSAVNFKDLLMILLAVIVLFTVVYFIIKQIAI